MVGSPRAERHMVRVGWIGVQAGGQLACPARAVRWGQGLAAHCCLADCTRVAEGLRWQARLAQSVTTTDQRAKSLTSWSLLWWGGRLGGMHAPVHHQLPAGRVHPQHARPPSLLVPLLVDGGCVSVGNLPSSSKTTYLEGCEPGT
jgi:hypothetical protein